MIIICYYGNPPDWMDLWILSCKKNPLFDFMLVSDGLFENYDCPSNVKRLQMSMEELRQRFSNVLGFEVALSCPYKLCDYRPVYGLAFQKELEDYDFWGHCDIDLIWGNLSKFIDDQLLDKYRRIGKYGHLTLYKNTDDINKLFMKQGAAFSYDIVFKDDAHYGFDEMTGINRIYNKLNIPYYTELPIVDANRRLTRVSVYPKTKDEVYFWYKGGIYRIHTGEKNKISEYAYLHFQKKHPVYKQGENYKDGFYIKAAEFKSMHGKICTLQEVQIESEYRSKYKDSIDLIWGTGKRILEFLFFTNIHEKKILLKKVFCYKLDQFKKLFF